MKLVAGAAMVGVSLGLVGCESSDAIVTETPTPTPTSPVISSSDASPSPSASGAASASPGASPEVSGAPLTDEELLEILPPGAELTDLQGALVTAPYFLAEYARMFHSGDTSVWDALSGPKCDYCASSTMHASELQKKGYSAEGGEIVVRESTIRANLGEDGAVYLTLIADVAEAVVESSSGVRKVTEDQGSATFTMKLVRVGDIWRVSGVSVDA